MTITQSPAAAPPAPADFLEACHDLLLRLAGRLPDDLLCLARRWLAQGRSLDPLRAVTFAVVADRLPIFAEELAFLIEALHACGGDASDLTEVEAAEVDPGTPFAFLAMPPELVHRLDSTGAYVPECLDHTALDGTPGGTVDDVDARAAGTARDRAGVLALGAAGGYRRQTARGPRPGACTSSRSARAPSAAR